MSQTNDNKATWYRCLFFLAQCVRVLTACMSAPLMMAGVACFFGVMPFAEDPPYRLRDLVLAFFLLLLAVPFSEVCKSRYYSAFTYLLVLLCLGYLALVTLATLVRPTNYISGVLGIVMVACILGANLLVLVQYRADWLRKSDP